MIGFVHDKLVVDQNAEQLSLSRIAVEELLLFFSNTTSPSFKFAVISIICEVYSVQVPKVAMQHLPHNT